MTKRVAWFTCDAKHKEAHTPYKVYEVINEEGIKFKIINDRGAENTCLKRGCAHLNYKDWIIADVVEEEIVKREGIVALLPEDSKFKIGQEVFVDMDCYKGVATIKGYNYNSIPAGYILETHEDVGATPYHNGLCKEGYALWASEKTIKAIPIKTKKWGEWIPNTTGEQPEGLDEDIKIKLHWSDGDVTKSTVGSANWFFSESVNITHYKVLLKDKPKWTKNTGVMPVDGNVKVEVKLRGGIKEISQADDFYWSFENEDTDIIKWRLAE